MTAASPDPIEDRAREHLPAGWIPTDPGIVAAFARAEIARELRAQAEAARAHAQTERSALPNCERARGSSGGRLLTRLALLARADALDPQ